MEIKRVVHLIKGLGRGGAERLLVSTIRNAGPEWSWEVIYFLETRDAMVPDLEALGCKVTCLSSFGVPGMFLRLPALISILRKRRIEVIHAHLPWSGIIARIAGGLTGIPVVYTEHNLFHHYRGLTRLFNRLTYGLQREVIAVSEQVASAIPAQLTDTVRVTVVNNGVDLIEFNPALFNRYAFLEKAGLPPDAFVVGNVASIRPQKRMDRWLDIAALVLPKDPRIHFLLVGGGKELEVLKQRVHGMPGADRIHLVGLQPEPAGWLALMDVFLMTSDYEGMPVALLEAMSMRCIPVSTPAGGIPTVVTDGVNGFLYEADDRATGAERILQLVGDASLRRQLSQAARRTVEERFGIGVMVRQLEASYRRVLSAEQVVN